MSLIWLRFASHLNFLDPQLTSDGQPYGPFRYKQIMKDCWYITKHIHTSYNEILKISPNERDILIEFISNDIRKHNEEMEEILNKSKN